MSLFGTTYVVNLATTAGVLALGAIGFEYVHSKGQKEFAREVGNSVAHAIDRYKDQVGESLTGKIERERAALKNALESS